MSLVSLPRPPVDNVVDFARRRDATLEPGPFTLATLIALYERHGERPQFMPYLLWCGDCIGRMKRGLEPTAVDYRRRADLQAQLRNALR
jgi:hypothetical protein